MICQQLSTQEIADKLFITVRTVEYFKAKIINKTNVRNTIGLVFYSIQKNLIDPFQIEILYT